MYRSGLYPKLSWLCSYPTYFLRLDKPALMDTLVWIRCNVVKLDIIHGHERFYPRPWVSSFRCRTYPPDFYPVDNDPWCSSSIRVFSRSGYIAEGKNSKRTKVSGRQWEWGGSSLRTQDSENYVHIIPRFHRFWEWWNLKMVQRTTLTANFLDYKMFRMFHSSFCCKRIVGWNLWILGAIGAGHPLLW